MTAINSAIDYAIEEGIAVVTVDYPPVNAMSTPVMDGLHEAFSRATGDDAVKALVLICAGRTFIAGADLKSLSDPNNRPKTDWNEVQQMMTTTDKPLVAAIHGTALGGGMELAMFLSNRVAVPSAKFGLTEVKLGLIPGGGGTQLLPRLVGATAALDLMTTGDQIGTDKALAIGLIDAVVPEGELREGAIAFARQIVASGAPVKRISELEDKIAEDRKNPGLFEDYRKANAKRLKGRDAPEKVIQCVEGAVNAKAFFDGMKVEQKIFGTVLNSPQNKALMHNFFGERAAAKVKDVPADTPVIDIRQVGIIGAGTMGRGIALAFLNGGFAVTMFDTVPAALENAQKLMRSSYDGQLKRGQITPDKVDARLAKLTPAGDLAALADCDLVIEAVFEDMDLKKELFGKLDKIVKQGAILASNTSFLDINVMAASTARPEAVVGMHFFSPANIMKLLEVVRGDKTSKSVIATVMKLAGRIGKVPVLSGVCHGFIGNRMNRRRREAGEQLALEGAAPARIDAVLEAFGFPMGPFAMSDMAGLDVGWSRQPTGGTTAKELLCEAGRYGQKNGKGYYDYDDKRNRTPAPVAVEIFRKLAQQQGVAQREFSDEEIFEDLMFALVNEGAKILEEGIAQRSSDIDITWVNGYSFPAYRGGPMFWADELGLDKVLAGMERMETRYGPDFAPAPLLRKLVAEGRGFGSL